MKKAIILSAILLIGVGLLAGCNTATSGSGSTTGGREYFPNTDGYSWTFRLSSPSTTETVTLKCTANGTTTVGGQTVQKVRTEMTYSTTIVSTAEFLVKISDTDVCLYGTTDYPTTEATKMIAFPLSVGNHWAVYGTQEAFVTAQENVSVPAGSYSGCFKINLSSVYQYGTSTLDFWLVNGVGVAKVTMTSTYGTTESTMLGELTAKNF